MLSVNETRVVIKEIADEVKKYNLFIGDAQKLVDQASAIFANVRVNENTLIEKENDND